MSHITYQIANVRKD